MGKKSDEKLPGRTVGWDKSWTREKTAPLLFLHRKEETVEIHARFPEAGLWYIGVQAGWKGQQAEGAVSINITVDRGMTDAPSFPETWGNLSAIDLYLVEPRERILTAGDVVRFVVESAEAKSVTVFARRTHQLDRDGTVFSGDVPVSAGRVVLVADFTGDGTFQYVLKYAAQ
jgi:hypothetical protein